MGTVQPATGHRAQGGTVPPVRAAPLPARFEHDGGGHDAAPLLIGQADDACLGNGVDAGEGLLHAAGLDLDAAGDDDVVQAPQDLQAPVGAQAATIGGGQEASAGALTKVLGGAGHPVGGVQVTLGEDRSGDDDAAGAVGVGILDGELDAAQGTAVVDTATAGLTHAVAGDHGDAGPPGPGQQRRIGGGAAQEDGVGLRQGPARRRVPQDAHQLGGDQGGVEAGGIRADRWVRRGPDGAQGLGERRRAESCARVDHHRCRSRQEGPHEDLQPGDVVGGQGQEPGAGAAQALVGGAGGGRQGRGAHGDEPAGAGGGAGGAQDQVGARGHLSDAAGQVGPDLIGVLVRADGYEQRKRTRGVPSSVLPVVGGAGGGGRTVSMGREQAALGQALGEGDAQGGDVVGGGSADKETKSGRAGHGMIVPRLRREGYAQVQGSAGPVGSVRVGPCVSSSSSWCSP